MHSSNLYRTNQMAIIISSLYRLSQLYASNSYRLNQMRSANFYRLKKKFSYILTIFLSFWFIADLKFGIV